MFDYQSQFPYSFFFKLSSPHQTSILYEIPRLLTASSFPPLWYAHSSNKHRSPTVFWPFTIVTLHVPTLTKETSSLITRPFCSVQSTTFAPVRKPKQNFYHVRRKFYLYFHELYRSFEWEVRAWNSLTFCSWTCVLLPHICVSSPYFSSHSPFLLFLSSRLYVVTSILNLQFFNALIASIKSSNTTFPSADMLSTCFLTPTVSFNTFLTHTLTIVSSSSSSFHASIQHYR